MNRTIAQSRFLRSLRSVEMTKVQRRFVRNDDLLSGNYFDAAFAHVRVLDAGSYARPVVPASLVFFVVAIPIFYFIYSVHPDSKERRTFF